MPSSHLLIPILAACLILCAQDTEPKPADPKLSVVRTSITVTDKVLEPGVDRRNSEVFSRTLFSRDDQVFHTLDAGINAGQHEGGGKSVEIRRFGFNLDHGGVSGGLKVLVDDVGQNQSTQGHGQGYLGSLKSISPELIQEVDVINGPFSAAYGDFSGLGVVHIRQRESMPDRLTLRLQGGSFATGRAFVAWSPNPSNADALFAYEGNRTNGPFLNPLHYKRDNLTGNYTWHLNEHRSFGIRFNGGLNSFNSSGQIPLDEVALGRLNTFGYVDPTDGGRVHSATTGLYFLQEMEGGAVLRVDGFVARSLFDLYSNFTFFLNDPDNGDGFRQHDSRLQEGANAQYTRPHKLFGAQAILTTGANFHDNQINVGLDSRVGRVPLEALTSALAHVTNSAGYVQENVTLFGGRMQVGAGMRFDEFRFDVTERIHPELGGTQSAGRWQPKASLAFTPTHRLPVTFYANYGRGISTADARGIVQRPDQQRVSTTDFVQLGTSHHFGRVSISTDVFHIARSNEQVYIPDDGSFEFKGPSRSYGFEAKSSVEITRRLSFNGGITKVANSYYTGVPRVYVDSAPHFVANAGFTLSAWRGWSGSLRMRAINHYRLDGEDPSIVASGHTVFDFGLTRRITRMVDFNLTLDNLAGRTYYETQNYFESQLPGQDPINRIHGTPGYPRTVMAGLTFRLGGK